MECPRSRTFAAIIVYLVLREEVLCHKTGLGNVRENRECTTLAGNPSSSDMLNSILSAAATNGVLPDLIPMLQGQQPIVDNLSKFPFNPDMLAKPLSVVPMPTSGLKSQEPIIFSSQPLRPPVSNQNVLLATPMPCGLGCPSNIIPSIPQTIPPPVLPSSNCVSQIAQALPVQNCPVCSPNVDVLRPMPLVLQPQSQFNEVNPYSLYNQITDMLNLPDVNTATLNLPMLPPINTCSGALEITTNLGPSCLSQPIVFASDSQSIPLQISVPAASVPAPRVTVVAASPANSPVCQPVPCCPDYSANLPPMQYPPQPPVILDGSSKSSWRNWLPILLVALFNDRGKNDAGGCCCCCNGGSGNTIPIPYPIPIPINNPIINNCAYPSSSRNREYRDDGDEDEDKKRK